MLFQLDQLDKIFKVLGEKKNSQSSMFPTEKKIFPTEKKSYANILQGILHLKGGLHWLIFHIGKMTSSIFRAISSESSLFDI